MAIVLVQLFVNGLLKGGVYALLSVGLTIVYGVARILNFAHGEFVMLSMYATYFLFSYFGFNPFFSLLIVFPLMFIIGIITYRGLFSSLVDKGRTAQIFATTGLSLMLQNIALIIWRGDPRIVVIQSLNKILSFGPISASLVETLGFALATSLMVGLFLFLKYTYAGKVIRAVVDDTKGAMLVGMNVKLLYQLAVAIGFACTGAAGAILVTIYYTIPAVGDSWKFISLIAVVLGGYTSIPGTVLASIIIGLIESFSGFFFSVQLKECSYFLVFLLVLLFRPQGLFGRKQ